MHQLARPRLRLPSDPAVARRNPPGRARKLHAGHHPPRRLRGVDQGSADAPRTAPGGLDSGSAPPAPGTALVAPASEPAAAESRPGPGPCPPAGDPALPAPSPVPRSLSPAAAPAAWGATPAPPGSPASPETPGTPALSATPCGASTPATRTRWRPVPSGSDPHTSPRSPGSGPAPLCPPHDLGIAALCSPHPLPQTYASKPTHKCPVLFSLFQFFIAPGFHRLTAGRVSGPARRLSERTAIRRVLADLCPSPSLISPKSATATIRTRLTYCQ